MMSIPIILGQLEAANPEDVDRWLLDLREHPDLPSVGGADALRAANQLLRSGLYPDLTDVVGLAMRAHQDGVEQAGIVFAETADKMAALEGRPQPFGTLVIEHEGELVQPPVDPGVTDEQRAELGLPALSVITAAALDETRRRARFRADQPGLPDGVRYARVWRDPDPAALRDRWAEVGAPAWADGDELTFVTESDVPVVVTPVFAMPSWDAGDGLQVLSLRIDRLAEAVITYTFQPTAGAAAPSFRRGSHDGRFRGPDAPPEAPSNDVLTGSLTDHVLESVHLAEGRRVTVYHPGSPNLSELPVVYATDGNMFAPFARRLDAAIERGVCPPVVIIAAHSATADQRGNFRAMEYLPGFDDRRFDAHQRFFVDELAQWAEREIGVTNKRSDRAVFGTSDGGGHALATGMLHPHTFGHVFGFSTGMPPDGRTQWEPSGHPMVHLCAGTLEDGFHQATQMWAYFLERIGAPHHSLSG
jgi:enterochelin esterase-like enzyme